MDALQQATVESGKEIVRADEMLLMAQAAILRGQPELEAAAEHLRGVKGYYKRVEDLRKDLVTPLNNTVKKINDLFRPALDLATKVENVWKRKIGEYHTEENRIRAQAEAKLRQDAAAREIKLQEQATKLREKGKDARAAVKEEEAANIPTPVVAEPEKPKGISYRDTWEFEVVDEDAVPREYLFLDHKKIGAVVRATKGTLEIPGIRVFKTTTVAAGSRE